MDQACAIIAAVNDDRVLDTNLKASDVVVRGIFPLSEFRNYASASRAYNDGIDGTTAPLLIFAHQDIYFPATWLDAFGKAVDTVNGIDPDWAVLGLFGATKAGERVGWTWSTGVGRELGGYSATPTPAVSLDEIVIILKRASGLRFDDALPGFHLYGTDIVRQALDRRLGAYVIHTPVIHNDRPVHSVRADYLPSYRYVKRKWKHQMPFPTVIAPVTRFELELWRVESWLLRRRLRRWRGTERPADRFNPREIARRLGYE
jgi:hypothetical protein